MAPTDIESDPPVLEASSALLRRHFASIVAAEMRPLRNPHHEPKVSEAVMRSARDAAVLIPFVERERTLTVVVTRRHRDIRFAGHICFPGGGCDSDDENMLATALRETEEEIGLDPARVEILGRLGDYYTQTGYRIAPFVGLLEQPIDLHANPEEVEEIIEIPFALLLAADSYRLSRSGSGRGHYSLSHLGVRVAGPTVSLMIGLYEELLRSTEAAAQSPRAGSRAGDSGRN